MLTQRSTEKELIDLGPAHYTAAEYQHCLQMLWRVNYLFGFFISTRRFLKQLSHMTSILDVGCGSGGFLLRLSRFFPKTKMVGVEVSADAIALANHALQQWQQQLSATNVTFELLPEPTLTFSANSFDVVTSTLMCHHLTDDELIVFLQQAITIAKTCVVIQDLHRHRVAEWLYRWVSPVLFRNRLITHDGLISIRRSFTRAEWQALLKRAGISRYSIRWGLPFRWRVVLWKQ